MKMDFFEAMEKRRSLYALGKDLPVGLDAVQAVLEHQITETPSPFNVQSARVVLLTDERHTALWDGLKEILRGLVKDPEAFAKQTAPKVDGFAAAAGTILYYEDTAAIKALQEAQPAYADRFELWGEHANAMLQHAVWVALAGLNVGANLQHYAPLIDPIAAKLATIPSMWSLIAQMPFGSIVQPIPADVPHLPVGERLIVS